MSDTAARRNDALAAARERSTPIKQVEVVAEPPVGLVRKAGRVAKFRARQASARLPRAVQDRLTRRRHLAHVTVNMGHLTHPALLGQSTGQPVGWIDPQSMPPAPLEGLGLEPLDPEARAAVVQWLASGTYDDDTMLDRRMDGQGDELGRARAALAVRLRLSEPRDAAASTGDRILVDARSLQSAAFGTRGIGRFARSALLALRAQRGDNSIDLLVDPGLEALPPDLAGVCRQVARVSEESAGDYAFLLQPSPMTASPEPLVPVLLGGAHRLAVVFDYIPKHLPDVYLSHVAARAEYAACLDALRRYDEFACISHLARSETEVVVGRTLAADEASVAWPAHVLPGDANPADRPGGRADGPIVVMTGDDARKNTFGALAGVGAATSGESTRDVVVLGMAGQAVRVHHWSIAAAIRPGETTNLERITDAEMSDLLARASLVVVASFDEGLSLPVIEAALAGAPVVASDIPAHRELIGTGTFLADPASPTSLDAAIRRHRGSSGTAQAQWRQLRRHEHRVLEEVVAESVRRNSPEAAVAVPAAAVDVSGRALRVGVATPWSPQKSGVADYSVATITALAEIADVTVYTTADARVEDLASRPVGEAVEHAGDHDVFLTVLGNSHFHLPHLDLMERIDTVALSHDTRMTEFYMALRGKGGVEQLMLRGTGRRALDPDLDEQVNDMRLLENAAFWEIAHRARMLVTHSPCAAPAISEQTGRPVRVLPFANYRRPTVERVTEPLRAQARRALHLRDDVVHLASFGYVDTRTKLSDTVVESAAWVQQWGRPVHLHLVGSASPVLRNELEARAREAGLAGFTITGYIDESAFRDYLLGVDLGIQLRVSPLLGVSGPLSDMAAYGTPALASSGLAIDVDAPSFIERLPDDVSPVMVAEAIERALDSPVAIEERETLRREYLDAKSPLRYVEQLLALLHESRSGGAA
jgi:glycosyltransferase involved in cell wall biosynthesis